MVRKLIKYDFRSFFRLLFPGQMILIGIALVNRIVQLFENETSVVYRAVFISSLVLYVIAIITLLLMSVIIAVVRFYQGMYSNEGYLSHTLPVTATQHLVAKLLISLMFIGGSVLSVFVSFVVITFGEVNIELFKSAGNMIKDYFSTFGFDGAVYAFELIVLLIAFLIASLLRYFFCISVGQLVSRKKILLAFGVYFGLYIIRQILGTILIIVVSLNNGMVMSVMRWFGEHPRGAVHIVMCVLIVFEIVMSAVYFLISRFIMSKKLNLT